MVQAPSGAPTATPLAGRCPDAQQCEQVVDTILAGSARVDALLNNAGYAGLGAHEGVESDGLCALAFEGEFVVYPPERPD